MYFVCSSSGNLFFFMNPLYIRSRKKGEIIDKNKGTRRERESKAGYCQTQLSQSGSCGEV